MKKKLISFQLFSAGTYWSGLNCISSGFQQQVPVNMLLNLWVPWSRNLLIRWVTKNFQDTPCTMKWDSHSKSFMSPIKILETNKYSYISLLKTQIRQSFFFTTDQCLLGHDTIQSGRCVFYRNDGEHLSDYMIFNPNDSNLHFQSRKNLLKLFYLNFSMYEVME
jgi:hypothetical protein